MLSWTFGTILLLALATETHAALRALWALLRGRKVRAWNQLCLAAAGSSAFYRRWVAVAEPQVMRSCLSAAPTARTIPGIACLILGEPEDTPAVVVATLRSLRRAFGGDLSVWTNIAGCDGCQSLSRDDLAGAIAALPLDCRWLLPLRAGDEVSPHLPAALAWAGREGAASDIIYWDEDRLGPGGRCDPWIKPDWDALLHAARDMVSGACLVARDSVMWTQPSAACSFAGMASVLRRICALPAEAAMGATAPMHVPLILSHRRSDPLPLAIAGPTATAREWPLASILIPTRDRADLLDACLKSLELLDYPGGTEWVIVDNGSTEPQALALLDHWSADARVRIVHAPGPFNFSALSNRAAQAARGEYLCLLNNDIEALDGGWLTAMMRQALAPQVGAVGALLLYPDRTVQHAGVAIGIGGAAGHVMKGVPVDQVRDREWFRVTREVSAVTAACLVVSRAKYQAVGGLDEDAFAVAFNDVDFCLKLKAAGLRNIFAADAWLIHRESKSRGSDMDAGNSARFSRELACLRDRWQTQGHDDPHYSPLFSRTAERCVLAF